MVICRTSSNCLYIIVLKFDELNLFTSQSFAFVLAIHTVVPSANAVTSTEIAANAVTTGKIVANAITATQIAANAITANEIQAGAIGVSELAANSVTANAIAANSVTASEIAAGTITASEIAANAITANSIAANAITGDKIIATTKITVGSGNNIGVLDGADSTYRIYAGHATPASAPFSVKQNGEVTIQTSTSSSASRLVISGDTIKVFNGSTLRVQLGNLA